ncbi:alpha-(1,3)-fucosyltransferase B-like [Pectinophora gossypiella]|uniref:alpha-(1,3)-fucosyltransferase B-like n=1 Tax=Pectinophora gossypiella TaxID=13191 RepID=UPI00214EAF07|nr:alpha-(1,3)-fucosyltransferase B-like [Pectinophora gossypiella]
MEFNADTFSWPKGRWKRYDALPSIVWYTTNIWWIQRNRRITCTSGVSTFECEVFKLQTAPENPNAYLFYGSDVHYFPLPRNSSVLWGLLHDESPANRLEFVYEEGLRLFNFSSTFSRFSDVPMPLMKSKGLDALTSRKYFVNTPDKNAALSDIAPVIYMQSDCYSMSERDAYVAQLMGYISIDSYGECLRNKDLPLSDIYVNVRRGPQMYLQYLYGTDLLNFISRYKFMIAIENAVCNDYVSEKLWRALEVGVVPIYYGSPLIRDWLPNNKSAILLEDFPTPELLSQHLHYLLNNDTAYEEYLEHKTLGRISNQKLLDDLKARSYQIDLAETAFKLECLICEKLYNNDDAVNMVTKNHYDCPMEPFSDLAYVPSHIDLWRRLYDDAKNKVDSLVKEIDEQIDERRVSNTSWWINDGKE